MAGSRAVSASPRLQFRLDLADEAQAQLYAELIAIPAGKRNAEIIRRLMRRDSDAMAAMIYAAAYDAVKAAIAGEGAAHLRADPAGGQLPGTLFDKSIF